MVRSCADEQLAGDEGSVELAGDEGSVGGAVLCWPRVGGAVLCWPPRLVCVGGAECSSAVSPR